MWEMILLIVATFVVGWGSRGVVDRALIDLRKRQRNQK